MIMADGPDISSEWNSKLKDIDFSSLNEPSHEGEKYLAYEKTRAALAPFEELINSEAKKLLEKKSLPEEIKRTESGNFLHFEYKIFDPSWKELGVSFGFRKNGNSWEKHYFAVIHKPETGEGKHITEMEQKGVFLFNDDGQIDRIRLQDPATGYGKSKLLDPVYELLDIPSFPTRPSEIELVFKNPSNMAIETNSPGYNAKYPVNNKGQVEISNASFSKIATKMTEVTMPKVIVRS